MTEKTITAIEAQHPYKSPNTKVVYVKMQNILCVSKPEKYITETEEGDDNW